MSHSFAPLSFLRALREFWQLNCLTLSSVYSTLLILSTQLLSEPAVCGVECLCCVLRLHTGFWWLTVVTQMPHTIHTFDPINSAVIGASSLWGGMLQLRSPSSHRILTTHNCESHASHYPHDFLTCFTLSTPLILSEQAGLLQLLSSSSHRFIHICISVSQDWLVKNGLTCQHIS